jgi:hypothetical protein
MEEAVVREGTITIDTTKQRIVTNDDLKYILKVFEDVIIIRNEEDPVADETKPLNFEEIARAISSFVETIKTKIEEAIGKMKGVYQETNARQNLVAEPLHFIEVVLKF